MEDNRDRRDTPLTSSAGRPVENDQQSVTTGKKVGYTMLNDVYLMEKLAHFDRERIPERVVHAKGAGAHGYFEVTDDISQYTRADFLSEVGKRTEVFARFSTVGGEKGSADSARDPRGFAIKFYTDEGNYDMVGNDIPIFFIRDAMKFPDFIHTQKRDPQTGLKDAEMFWDFLSLTPESVHQTTFLFTDRGTPKDFRHMHGFSSHTYMFYNRRGEHCWFKWHWVADLGFETLTDEEATMLAGTDPDHATRDLFEAIERGDFPSWTVYIQLMMPDEAKEYRFDPFDVTKVWFHGDYPLRRVGKMVLDRNPENFFAEVEQAAFCPSNLVPGIYPSPDKLLQGRLFSYKDTQRHRLGANHEQIPINMPRCPHYTNERDAPMTVNGNYGSTENYYPNSVNEHSPAAMDDVPMITLEEATMGRHELEIVDDDFFQTGEFWRRVLDQEGKDHLVSNICGHLQNAPLNIQYRQCSLFQKCDPEYGMCVARGLGLDTEKVEHLASLSQEDRVAETMPMK